MNIVDNSLRFVKRVEREVPIAVDRGATVKPVYINSNGRTLDIKMDFKIPCLYSELTDFITPGNQVDNLYTIMNATFLPANDLADPSNYTVFKNANIFDQGFSLFKRFHDSPTLDFHENSFDIQLMNRPFMMCVKSPLSHYNAPYNAIINPIVTSPLSEGILSIGVGSQQILNQRTAGYCNIFLTTKGYSSSDYTGMASPKPGFSENLRPLSLMQMRQDIEVEVLPLISPNVQMEDSSATVGMAEFKLHDPAYVPDNWKVDTGSQNYVLQIPKDAPIGTWYFDFDIFIKS